MMPKDSILLEACKNGEFGRVITNGSTMIYEAGFIYLDGEPDREYLLHTKEEAKWENRMYICLNEMWEKELVRSFSDVVAHTRYIMKQKQVDEEYLKQYIDAVTKEYVQTDFDEEIFSKHPFWHGCNYASYQTFKNRGVGSVVCYKGEIVASASSYLTYKNCIELDVSTVEEHRKKGLAMACCASVLLQSKKKGYEVHWDAQNETSKCMAMRLGYELEKEYVAYIFNVD